ncbi:MAG: NAD(P)H-dependent glycerol-3-phosphate dehydrogenase [Chitinivibrionales bacterium]|nr:NAD(P)H-dependent glycerol-3-phosphate dehydrogenase [Chitinivibrionales bacterium]MBD3395943.1 NAD(P)H-dependent glycerol-3-phosphate dehydrogenase [Chitinivibrionales bacterium]
MNISILGAGSWGIALSELLATKGYQVRMWEFDAGEARMLSERREHPQKLPGIRIPESVLITNSVAASLEGAQYVICAVPAQVTRQAAKVLATSVPPAVCAAVKAWIIVSKGIECATLELLSDVLKDEVAGLSDDRIVILSGPSHAEEVSRNIPTTVVAASTNNDLAVAIQNEFSTETFRIYTNNDTVGVQLCASVKNVIALAAGICDGLGFGDNTKGALLTRGMVEMARLGTRMGADQATFAGLAGFGDLITTCISRHSRNRRMGEFIGSGMTLKEALTHMTMVAEGVETTKSVYELARKHGIEMPISTEVYRTLFEGKPARQAVRDLMLRQVRPEVY